MVSETSAAEAQPAPAEAPVPPPSSDSREHYWEELTDAQKIERLRGVVKFLDEALGRERALRRKLVEQFVRHNHDAHGYPTMSIREGELNNLESDFDSPPMRLSRPWI